MKDILLTVLTVSVVLILSFTIGEYHHPDDKVKALIATNRVLIVAFYGTWIYTSNRKGE